jgi:hypothetical protein
LIGGSTILVYAFCSVPKIITLSRSILLPCKSSEAISGVPSPVVELSFDGIISLALFWDKDNASAPEGTSGSSIDVLV